MCSAMHHQLGKPAAVPFSKRGRVWGPPIATYWLASHREDGNEAGAEMRPLFSFVNIKLWPEVTRKALRPRSSVLHSRSSFGSYRFV
jgi:hypothetical protein